MAQPSTSLVAFGSLTSEVSVGPSSASEITILEKICQNGLLDTAGTQFKAEVFGDFTTNASPPNMTYKLYYGATAVCTIAAHAPTASAPNDGFEVLFWVTTRSSGSVYASGIARYHDATTATEPNVYRAHGTAAPTTTGEVTVKVTAQWASSDANNDLDVQQAHFYVGGDI